MSLPVTIIGGYLGAGKTTLINQLLRQADGTRLAVLVNEFGALPIDADLIQAQDGDVISISGGCVCCAFGDNLVGAIGDMVALAPDHIVIEASGVAIPGAIAATLSLIAGVSLAGIVVLADAETVQARAADRYMGDTILRQIGGADLILLSKVDLVAKADLGAVTAWLCETSGGGEVITTTHGQCPNAVVLGPMSTGLSEAGSAPDHSALYLSLAFAQSGETDATALGQALADAALGLVRAKGFVAQPGGTLSEVQVAGRRWAVSQGGVGQGLVCIGLRARMDQARVIALAGAHGFYPA